MNCSLFQPLMTNLSMVGTVSNNSYTTVDWQPGTSLKQFSPFPVFNVSQCSPSQSFLSTLPMFYLPILSLPILSLPNSTPPNVLPPNSPSPTPPLPMFYLPILSLPNSTPPCNSIDALRSEAAGLRSRGGGGEGRMVDRWVSVVVGRREDLSGALEERQVCGWVGGGMYACVLCACVCTHLYVVVCACVVVACLYMCMCSGVCVCL